MVDGSAPRRSERLADEEELLRRYHRTRDPAVREELVARFMPLARSLANRYAGGSEPTEDLHQVASLGLVKAIDRFDVDRSGNISLDEFRNALVAFRYRLSDRFTELLFRTYDKRGEGVMSFDLFVQACISLKRMTDVFKRYDDDRDGYITLSFEDFLTEILRQLR